MPAVWLTRPGASGHHGHPRPLPHRQEGLHRFGPDCPRPHTTAEATCGTIVPVSRPASPRPVARGRTMTSRHHPGAAGRVRPTGRRTAHGHHSTSHPFSRKGLGRGMAPTSSSHAGARAASSASAERSSTRSCSSARSITARNPPYGSGTILLLPAHRPSVVTGVAAVENRGSRSSRNRVRAAAHVRAVSRARAKEPPWPAKRRLPAPIPIQEAPGEAP